MLLSAQPSLAPRQAARGCTGRQVSQRLAGEGKRWATVQRYRISEVAIEPVDLTREETIAVHEAGHAVAGLALS